MESLYIYIDTMQVRILVSQGCNAYKLQSNFLMRCNMLNFFLLKLYNNMLQFLYFIINIVTYFAIFASI